MALHVGIYGPLLSLEISVDDPCPAKELLGIPLGHLDVHNQSQSYSGSPMVGQVGFDISIVTLWWTNIAMENGYL